MRVLHVISGLGTGGAESFLAALAERLAADHFEQEVVSVTTRGANAGRLEAAGIAVHALGVSGLASAAASAGKLGPIVKRFRPAVIQGWMYHGDLFATYARSYADPKPKLFWNIRCSDMRLDEYSLQLRLAVRASAALSRWPTAVLANSRAGAEIHKKAGYQPRELIIIPNGIDTARFAPDQNVRDEVRRGLGISPDDRVFIHVARVDPMKDHLTLLKAFERVEGGKGLLIGKGTEALSLPMNVLALGERRDVVRLLTAGDAIVSSSAFGEGFSNAIAEGMSAGLVPIATDVGDTREIVGPAGTVLAPRDDEGLARAMNALVRLSRSEIAARGLAARQRIADNFALDKAVARFAALYRG